MIEGCRIFTHLWRANRIYRTFINCNFKSIKFYFFWINGESVLFI